MLATLLFSSLFALAPQAPAAPQKPAPVRIQQAPVEDEEEVPIGKCERTIAVGPYGIQTFFYRPERWIGQRMIVVMHGVLRNADEYRDHSAAMGDRLNALIVAPKFDSERFPSRAYQRGGILREDGTAAPIQEWTYSLIPPLAASVRSMVRVEGMPYTILGHSAGGQFVMRMSAFMDTGAERLVAANPGTDLFPLRSMPFGYGFGGLPEALSNDDAIRRYLAAPLTIYLGTADDQPDENFETSERGMAQGSGRHQRGLACYWTAKTLAESRGWTFGWRLVEAQGVGHDHEKMFNHPNCELALYGTGGVPMPEAKSGLPADQQKQEQQPQRAGGK
jgi:pimeloyl-ACP methyl ester carboxylesterase